MFGQLLPLAALLLAGIVCCHGARNNTSGVRAKWSPTLPNMLRVSAFNIKTFGRAKMSDPKNAAWIRDVSFRIQRLPFVLHVL